MRYTIFIIPIFMIITLLDFFADIPKNIKYVIYIGSFIIGFVITGYYFLTKKDNEK